MNLRYRHAMITLLLCCMLLMLPGCASTSKDRVLETTKSQVELRSFQTRAFDTTDREKMLRTIISTLQDLGFVIDKADSLIGLVSATKLDKYKLRITVTVRQRGNSQLLVRANAQYNLKAVEDPQPYQDFFSALEKGMFLTAHAVD